MQEFFNDIGAKIGPFMPIIEVICILLGAWLLHWVVQRIINRSVLEIVAGAKRKRGVDSTQAIQVQSPLQSVRTVQRARTIGQVLSNVVTTIILIVATLWVIGVISPKFLSSLTLLSAALGAGLGFGAQKIVGDVLNGMFMVVEDQIGVGDEVDLDFAVGIVEAVGIRVTQVRDIHGQLWYVRNGEIQRVGNNSQGWNRAIIDVAIPFGADRERAQKAMLKAGREMFADVDWMTHMLEEPTIWGLQTLSAESVVVRMVAKTMPGERWGVERELRARLQDAFKEADIKLPPINLVAFDGPNGIEPGANENASFDAKLGAAGATPPKQPNA